MDEFTRKLLHIKQVIKHIHDQSQRLQREPPTIVAVTKGHGPVAIKLALAAGLTHIGENYVQEAIEKQKWLQQAPSAHFIGHLQRNKVKDALPIFDWIQTIDSFRLLQKIGRTTNQLKKPLQFMIQVNTTQEPQKHGLLPSQVIPFLEQYITIKQEYPYLSFRGLMTMGKKDDPFLTRKAFQICHQLGMQIMDHFSFTSLEYSYGMSQDYMIALEEGTTMLRLGTILFGPRQSTPK